jgi:hypothetical protein
VPKPLVNTPEKKEQGMPPYVTFHDATLRLIAATPPSTLMS